jgi:hypothetical protein
MIKSMCGQADWIRQVLLVRRKFSFEQVASESSTPVSSACLSTPLPALQLYHTGG